jgi:hypothetical protein
MSLENMQKCEKLTDTPASEIQALNSVSRKEFEKLQRKLQKYKEENRTLKEFIKILARKDGSWCDDCEKVLEDHEMLRCDGPRCFPREYMHGGSYSIIRYFRRRSLLL